MIAYFDKNHDVHLADDMKLLDVNMDAIARAVIVWAKTPRPPRRKRLPRKAK